MAAISFEKTAPQTTNAPVDLTEEEKMWMSNEFWPTPKWLEKDDLSVDLKDHKAYLKYQLRTRYLELEGDFRTAYNNFAAYSWFDKITARRIIDLLSISRKALERSDVNLLNIGSALGLIDRYLIWIFPFHVVKQRLGLLSSKLDAVNPEYSEFLKKSVEQNNTPDNIGHLRAIYDEAVGELNRIETSNQISFGLQIERLSLLKVWGIVLFLILAAIVPMFYNTDELGAGKAVISRLLDNPSFAINPAVLNWVIIFIIAAIGATGGFVSGLLQIRSTKVGLIEFKESLLKFQLKPIIGGITAILVSLFLSWQMLPGIKVEGIGTFIFIAFLSGFSERYFLKLIKLDSETESQKTAAEVKEVAKDDVKVIEQPESNQGNNQPNPR